MIAIIRSHMLFGSAITVDERDYNTWAARGKLETAYSDCCWQTIASINVWMDQNKRPEARELLASSPVLRL
jgi:hypothetical protein